MEQLANPETQDKILAGVVAIYGESATNDIELIDYFKAIEDRLKGKLGEQVLVISRKEIIINCVGFGADPEYVLQITSVLGELNDEELVFNYDARNCSLPTSRFAFTSQGDLGIEISDTVIGHRSLFDHEHIFDVGSEFRRTVGDWGVFSTKPVSSDRFPSLEILIGNNEIEAWLSACEQKNGWHTAAEISEVGVLRDQLSNGRLF